MVPTEGCRSPGRKEWWEGGKEMYKRYPTWTERTGPTESNTSK